VWCCPNGRRRSAPNFGPADSLVVATLPDGARCRRLAAPQSTRDPPGLETTSFNGRGFRAEQNGRRLRQRFTGLGRHDRRPADRVWWAGPRPRHVRTTYLAQIRQHGSIRIHRNDNPNPFRGRHPAARWNQPLAGAAGGGMAADRAAHTGWRLGLDLRRMFCQGHTAT
jgi:hypothetical protein